MKKVLFLFALLLSTVAARAEGDAVTAKVSGTTLSIGLENATTFIAFQMDITLPEGVSATDVEKTGRLAQGPNVTINGEDTATPFIIAYNTLANGKLRVIAYNLGNHAISQATGDILTITLSAAVSDPTTITVDNILFVKSEDLTEVAIDAATGEQGALRGDVNMDGEVGITDLGALVNILLGKSSQTPTSNVDGSEDGLVGMADLGVLVNILLGKTS